MTFTERIHGANGSIGPFGHQYHDLHVYARDVYSGSGNCVCGRHLYHPLHTEAAPGIPLTGRVGEDQ